MQKGRLNRLREPGNQCNSIRNWRLRLWCDLMPVHIFLNRAIEAQLSKVGANTHTHVFHSRFRTPPWVRPLLTTPTPNLITRVYLLAFTWRQGRLCDLPEGCWTWACQHRAHVSAPRETLRGSPSGSGHVGNTLSEELGGEYSSHKTWKGEHLGLSSVLSQGGRRGGGWLF